MFDKIRKYLAYHNLSKYQDKILFKEELQTRKKPYTEIENNIGEEQKEYRQQKRQTKLPSQSKLLLLFLFINFTVLEIFIGQITIQSFSLAMAVGLMPDFTPLVTLIGAVIGETLSYQVYSAKSKAENTQGGIVYEAFQQQKLQEQRNEDGTFG